MTKSAKSKTISAGSIALISDSVALSLAIQESRIAGETLQANIHTLALSAVYHADQHKNNTPLLELVSGMGNGLNLKAMNTWLKKFTAYDFKAERQATALKKAIPAKIHKSSRKISFTRAADRNKAAKTPYFEIRNAARAPKAFDVNAYVETFSKKIEGLKEALTPQQIDTINVRLLAISQNLNSQDETPVVSNTVASNKTETAQAAATTH